MATVEEYRRAQEMLERAKAELERERGKVTQVRDSLGNLPLPEARRRLKNLTRKRDQLQEEFLSKLQEVSDEFHFPGK